MGHLLCVKPQSYSNEKDMVSALQKLPASGRGFLDEALRTLARLEGDLPATPTFLYLFVLLHDKECLSLL